MALKDWKRTKNGNWVNKSLGESIFVGFFEEKEKYEFEIFKSGKVIRRRFFKTKSEAMSFAKDYMRDH